MPTIQVLPRKTAAGAAAACTRTPPKVAAESGGAAAPAPPQMVTRGHSPVFEDAGYPRGGLVPARKLGMAWGSTPRATVRGAVESSNAYVCTRMCIARRCASLSSDAVGILEAGKRLEVLGRARTFDGQQRVKFRAELVEGTSVVAWVSLCSKAGVPFLERQ